MSMDGLDFTAERDKVVLQRLRVDIDVVPTRWLKFHLQGQDARDFFTTLKPAPDEMRDPLDLRQAYVEIGDSESGRFSFRAGRQSITLGEGRFLGDGDWSNVGRSFDGVRLMANIHSVRLDAFSGMMDEIRQGSLSQPMRGEHLHGVSAGFAHLVPRATIEPFAMWRLAHDTATENGLIGHRDEKVVGIRWVGELPLGFDYGADLAWERGTIGNEPIRAWTQHYLAGFTLPNQHHKPRLYAEFTQASGDRNPRDGVHNTFDPLFPSGHDDFGLADRFDGANLLHERAGFQYRLREHLQLNVAHNSVWVANRQDGLYAGTTEILPANTSGSRYVAQEVDLELRWQWKPTSFFTAGYGHVFPGEWLRVAGVSHAYDLVFIGITQRL